MKLNTAPKLVEYGIQTDQSDMRVHVCVKAKRVYYFRTADGPKAIDPAQHRKVPARQPGVSGVTALGYLVPPEAIKGCQWAAIPDAWLKHSKLKIEPGMSTAEKGDRATLIVFGLVKTGRIPLLSDGSKIEQNIGSTLQITGVDLRVTVDIQVKCDMNGGHKDAGGSGNLFLQTHESNPLRMFGETAKDRRPKEDDLVKYAVNVLGGEVEADHQVECTATVQTVARNEVI